MKHRRTYFLAVPAVALMCAWVTVPAQAEVVDDTSLATPGFYNGTGNSNTNFTVDTEGNLELGLSIINRFVGPIDPGANSNVYSVTPSAGPLANWDFEFSVNTQAGGGSNDLDAYTYSLLIQDVTTNTSAPAFNPVTAFADNSGWDDTKTCGSGNPLPCLNGVNTATNWGAQNAENLGFFGGGFDPTAGDEYEFTLTATDATTHDQVGSVTVFAQTTPEPGTSLLLIPAGLVGLFAFLKKRKTATV